MVNIEMSESMVKAVEELSRNHTKSKVWFQYCTGRITASKIKAVCHTDPAKPSQSLIKQICYPQEFVFQSKQTKWGYSHEEMARKIYDTQMKESHTNFVAIESGLTINSPMALHGSNTRWQSYLQLLWYWYFRNKMPLCTCYRLMLLLHTRNSVFQSIKMVKFA